MTNRGDEAPVQSFTCTIPDQVAFPGTVLCVLTPAQTAAMTAATYQYDIQIQQDVDHIQTYVTGTITMGKEATKNV